MTSVVIYKLLKNGSQKILATCALKGGQVKCEGDRTLVDYFYRHGIRDYSQPARVLFPKDGMSFIEQLKHNFKSSYLNAVEVK